MYYSYTLIKPVVNLQMEENEEEHQPQGVIKTVASPTVLAAILDQTIDDKQTFNSLERSSLEEKCLVNSEQQKIVSLNMDRSGEESILNDSFVDDSLEFSERSLENIDAESEKQKTDCTPLPESILRANSDNNNSKDAKPLNKTAKNKQITKQKARETNFVDLNKERLNRATGKSSYAAMYSQKVKQKQNNSKQNQDKDNATKEKTKDQKQPPFSYDSTKQNNYSSIPIQDRVSSLSIHDGNYEKSPYYYVDPSYSQNNYNNTYPSANQTTVGYNSYLSQPYHVPYKDFGLRYSNHGHQTYMAPSSLGHSRPMDNTSVNQAQPYHSQSAPPGAPTRQPLLDKVEFFPEQEHYLSRTLSNSQFINPLQLYQRELVLERRFVSEPQLYSVLERGKENGASDDITPRKADYKPYTLKEYKQINDPLDKLGGLGPETESDEYKEKVKT